LPAEPHAIQQMAEIFQSGCARPELIVKNRRAIVLCAGDEAFGKLVPRGMRDI
jgi:hypothetical protein